MASHQSVVNINIIIKFLIGHKAFVSLCTLSHCVLLSLTLNFDNSMLKQTKHGKETTFTKTHFFLAFIVHSQKRQVANEKKIAAPRYLYSHVLQDVGVHKKVLLVCNSDGILKVPSTGRMKFSQSQMVVLFHFVNQYLLQYYHNLRKKNNGLMVIKIRDKYF